MIISLDRDGFVQALESKEFSGTNRRGVFIVTEQLSGRRFRTAPVELRLEEYQVRLGPSRGGWGRE